MCCMASSIREFATSKRRRSVTAQSQPKSPIVQLSAAEERYFGESLFHKGLRHLSHDYLTLIALGILALLAALALFGPIITENVLHIDPNTTDPFNNFLPIG